MNNNLNIKLSQYKDMSWESLIRTDLGKYSLEDVRSSFNKIREIFDYIISFLQHGTLPDNYASQLLGRLDNFFGFGRSIMTEFNNVSDRQQWITRVKNYEFDTWLTLKDVIEYIDFTYPKKEVDTKQYIDKIQKAVSFADSLLGNQDKYNSATQLADNWIKSQGKVVTASIQEKSTIFNDKSREHKGWRIWGWFIGGIFGVLASAGLVIFFILESGANITTGAALLRISTLVITSYFSFYCLQQFTNHRKLYEIYKFKAIALKTMEELYKSYTNDNRAKEEVLGKGASIIFSEPVLKEDSRLEQRAVEDFMDILRKRV